MATQTQVPPVGPDTRRLLAQLRRRIRIYVGFEGLAVALVWLGLTFWIGLAIDYLPVLVGASEMPRNARAVMLIVIAVILAYVLYRWVLRRALARMPDPSMALLLERQFRRFEDGLVTSVELAERPDHSEGFNAEMLAVTARRAESASQGVRVGPVFRLTPLVAKSLFALAALAPIGLLYALNPAALETWVNRLYLLRDDPWPRSTHVELAGIQIQRIDPTNGAITLSPLLPFNERREIKVAKGTSVIVKVRADATKVVPDSCTIYYRTADDQSGQVTMSKQGRIRGDNTQLYAFDGKPFRGILSSITFDVRGKDHRIRDYHLTVVPSPAIVETNLDCAFPDYMVNEQLSLWLPRTIPLSGGTQLPNGTRIQIQAKANKDLVRAEIRNPETGATTVVDVEQAGSDRRLVTYDVPALTGLLTLEWTLHDVDGVTNDPPHTMTILGLEDQPPTVNVTLSGIGTAVTPNVVLPATGTVEDDYDVAEVYFEVVLNEGQPRKFPFAGPLTGTISSALDFRQQRSTPGGLTIQPQDKLIVTIKATDRCNLNPEPNVGSGDRYQLDVVTSDELLALLERRELGLRRRFEQIIDEVTETRDSLTRVRRQAIDPRGVAPEDSAPTEKTPPEKSPEEKAPEDQAAPATPPSATFAAEPEPAEPEPAEPDPAETDPAKPDSAEPGSSAAAAPDSAPAPAPDQTDPSDPSAELREQSLRLLYTQRALVASQKSAQEVLGVAGSFDDIRQELINNRVDTEDRKIRLKEQIADPLRLIGDTMYPELDRLLRQLETRLDDPAASDEAADLAIGQLDDILVELDKILQKMLELETYNELVNLVRSLVEQQKELMEKTKQERVKQARELLK